jgi:hypothetical protein
MHLDRGVPVEAAVEGRMGLARRGTVVVVESRKINPTSQCRGAYSATTNSLLYCDTWFDDHPGAACRHLKVAR